jgi:hypothetical protein
MTLSTMIGDARAANADKASTAMDGLTTIARRLQMKECGEKLQEAAQGLRSDTFRLIVVGRFKAGKSTLLNGLIGRPIKPVPALAGHNRSPLPSDYLPCTATLTAVYYADEPWVRVLKMDGGAEEWSFERYLRDSCVRADGKENSDFFGAIRGFQMGFPAALCQSGVTLIDSPGVDDDARRTQITLQALATCDAAIMVYGSRALIGQGEREFAEREVQGSGTRVFSVINVDTASQNDPRIQQFTWERLVEGEGGPPFQKQSLDEFAARGIFFVNALTAMNGKLESDDAKVSESGLAFLEEHLGQFLLRERHHQHLQKFVRLAQAHTATMVAQIAEQRAALDVDEKELRAKFEAVQPQLKAIRRRRDKLPPLFARYREECRAALEASFADMIERLDEDMEYLLSQRPLQSLDTSAERALGQFQQKKAMEEASALCAAIINEATTAWAKNPPDQPGVAQVLAPILERLLAEVEAEVDNIEKDFQAVSLEMSGWQGADGVGAGADANAGVVSQKERILATVMAGPLLGPLAILGASGGWRSTAGSAFGMLAGGLVVASFAGLAPFALPVVFVSAIAGSVFGGSHNMEARVKAKVLEVVRPQLRERPEKARPQLQAEVESTLGAFETEIMKEVLAVIEEQERKLRRMVEINKRDLKEKEQLRAGLDEMQTKISAFSQTLSDVLAAAKPG